MTGREPRPVWLVRAGVFAGFFVPYLAVVLVLQAWSGAYQSELSHYPDEAAHVTTTLMVRDYLASGFSTAPLPFARNFYAHYPKVAFGMWPPVFYMAAGAWTLAFGATKTSLLALMALIGALFATTLGLFARRVFGTLAGFGLGLLLILIPSVQAATSMVMLDTAVSLLELCSLWLLIRYLRTGQTRIAAAFGAVAALAMLTKANGIALVFLPPLLILLARRFDLLNRRGPYVAASISVGLGLPWQIVSYKMLSTSVPMAKVDAVFLVNTMAQYLTVLRGALGSGVLLVALAGLGVECIRLLRNARGASCEMGGVACLLAAVVVFHSINPMPADERYMLATLPMLILCFAAGVRWIARILSGRLPSPVPVGAPLAALFLIPVALKSFSIPPRPLLGFAPVAEQLSRPELSEEVSMVCSDANGEGAFIVEMALRDRRLQRIVIRASKVISDNPWTATVHKPVVRTTHEVLDFLDSVPVATVVVDKTKSMWAADQALLLRALDQAPPRWSLMSGIPASAASRQIAVYRRIKSFRGSGVRVRIPMTHTLGGDIEIRR